MARGKSDKGKDNKKYGESFTFLLWELGRIVSQLNILSTIVTELLIIYS